MMANSVIPLRILFSLLLALWASVNFSDATKGDLKRYSISNSAAMENMAVCNDYTIPNYYLSDTASDTWVIFLEGGGMCSDEDSCAKRYGSADKVLMTAGPAVQCGGESATANMTFPCYVRGYDILSMDEKENHAFASARRVLIPYCSSDLWLGRSDINEALANETFKGGRIAHSEFARGDQFAYRGAAIVRAVISDLKRSAGFCNASSVLLAGSSAGGIGALNTAAWLRAFLNSKDDRTGCARGRGRSRVHVAALGDSQWFIDFHNVLQRQVSLWALSTMRLTAERDLYDRDDVSGPNLCTLRRDNSSYPCCISTRCLLETCEQDEDQDGSVPIFTAFSLADVYLPGHYELPRLANISSRMRAVAEVLRLMTEYSGAVNYSLTSVRTGRHRLSHFAVACLQHVILATSSLWDSDATLGKLMGSIYGEAGSRFFRHTIKPGRWNTMTIKMDCDSAINRQLCICSGVPPGKKNGHITLQCAISTWFKHVVRGNTTERIRLLDTCDGMTCNDACPETIQLGELTDDWSTGTIAATLCCSFIYILSLMCVLYKVYMRVRLLSLLKLQRRFLTSNKESTSNKKQIEPLQRFEAIGIACLDITYRAVLSKAAMEKINLNRKEEESRQEQASILSAFNSFEDASPTLTDSATDTLLSGESLDASEGNNLPAKRRVSASSLQALGMFQKRPAPADRMYRMSVRSDMEVSPWRACLQLKGRAGKSKPSTKKILHRVSTYFNPGNLIAVMGPSGSGKTTLLDLLTGRRRSDRGGQMVGKIYINGCKYDCLPDWYIRNTGYVMQLAIPYFEELTVRQNLTLAAHLRLSDSLTEQEKFERVEQVIAETGMSTLADIVVGGSTGLGLSGGQKRRLCVALQLLDLPKVLFLDEPTSGLDTTSSMELLKLLNMTAASGRLIIVTIHQPRLEIFHMFDIILLLCQGTVAYYGTPIAAPDIFLSAIQESCADDLKQFADQNPADVLIDLLSVERYRNIIMGYYAKSEEPVAVKNAVKNARDERSASSHSTLPENMKRTEPRAGWWTRIFVHESRASIRNTTTARAYLPVIYLIYAFAVGSAYYKANDLLLHMSAFCIWSFAPSIFMFPAVHNHLSKVLEIFRLEKEDGIGRTWEIVMQSLLRFSAITTLPIIACTAILYMMIMHTENWEFADYLQLTAISLQLNMVWTSFAIFLLSINPAMGFKVAPLITSVTGFVGGFLIPKPEMKPWYAWMFYINPNYYGYSAMMFIFLDKIELACKQETELECYHNTGNYYLERFGFDDTQPYLSVLVMIIMMVFFAFLSLLVLEFRFNHLMLRIVSLLPDTDEKTKDPADLVIESGVSTLQSQLNFRHQPADGWPSPALSGGSRLSAYMANQLPITPESSVPSCAGSDPGNTATTINNDSPLPQMVDPSKRKLRRRVTESRLLDGLEHTVYTPRHSKSSLGVGMSRRDRLLETHRKVESRRSQLELTLLQRASSLQLFDITASSPSGIVSPFSQRYMGLSSDSGSKNSRRVQFAAQHTKSEVIPGTLPRFQQMRGNRVSLQQRDSMQRGVLKAHSLDEQLVQSQSTENVTVTNQDIKHYRQRFLGMQKANSLDGPMTTRTAPHVDSPLLQSPPVSFETEENTEPEDESSSFDLPSEDNDYSVGPTRIIQESTQDSSAAAIQVVSPVCVVENQILQRTMQDAPANTVPVSPSVTHVKRIFRSSAISHPSDDESLSADDSDGDLSSVSFETYEKQAVSRTTSILSSENKKDTLEALRLDIVDKPRSGAKVAHPRRLSFQDSRKGKQSWWPEEDMDSPVLSQRSSLGRSSPPAVRQNADGNTAQGEAVQRNLCDEAVSNNLVSSYVRPSSSQVEGLESASSPSRPDGVNSSHAVGNSSVKSRMASSNPFSRLLSRRRLSEDAAPTQQALAQRVDGSQGPSSPPESDESFYVMSSV